MTLITINKEQVVHELKTIVNIISNRDCQDSITYMCYEIGKALNNLHILISELSDMEGKNENNTDN